MVLLSLALAWAVDSRIIVSNVLAVTGIVWKNKTSSMTNATLFEFLNHPQKCEN